MLMENTSTWIAVIDDEEGIRRALLRLLRSAGLEAHAFISGKAFLDSLRTKRPACVLLDLNMQDMSGFAVIKTLEQIDHELPVLVLTGQDLSDKQKNAELAHAMSILQKPVNDQELFAALAATLVDQKNHVFDPNSNLVTSNQPET
ncbi:response regulator receiver domain-containing protein [Undibacterium pigrum]|uniref:Response regulator receiver domain-containing protein n=2 Tax=Undibacterium pigrum TaxID=401470 RepID=A0A318J4U9_9BURK|nr:response regulator receiver domain-containing protein [Undibacterium pigrum]